MNKSFAIFSNSYGIKQCYVLPSNKLFPKIKLLDLPCQEMVLDYAIICLCSVLYVM